MRRSHADLLVLAEDLARPTYGLVSRHLLRTHGLDRHRLRRMIALGDAVPYGRHAVRVTATPWDSDRSPIAAAVMNCGPTAWADGQAALVLAGLTGHPPGRLDVGVPENATSRHVPGVHRHRRRRIPPLRHSPLLHTEPTHAALRAAAWADDEAEASRLLSLCVRQGLTAPTQLLRVLNDLPNISRRSHLKAVLTDLAQGYPSLYALDLPRLCRRHGLPEPDEVDVRPGGDSATRLRAHWTSPDVTVEVHTADERTPTADLLTPLVEGEIVPDGARIFSASQTDLQGCPNRVLDELAGHLISTQQGSKEL